MGVDALEVGEHDIVIKVVLVLDASVFDYGVGHRVLVVAAELLSASRALLLVDHQRTVSERTTCAATGRQRTVSWVYMPAA